MDNIFMLGLTVLFFLAVLADIFGHRLLKIKRTFFEGLLICALILCCGLFGFFTVKGYMDGGREDDSAHYLAYRYLMDGNGAQAFSVMEHRGASTDVQTQMIELLALCQNEDFISTYFKSGRMMNEGRADEDLLDSIIHIHEMSAEMLAIPVDEKPQSESLNTPPRETPQELSYDEQYKQRIMDYQTQVSNEIQNCFDLIEPDDSGMLEDLYVFHKEAEAGNYDKLTLDDVMDAVEEYKGDAEILKLVIKYAVGTKAYEEAVDLAKELLKLEKSTESYIILTDVIAQGVLDGYSITPDDDQEKEKLLDKADALKKRAAKYNDTDGAKARLLNSAEDLYKQAAQLDVYRAINYLEAKKPFLFDSMGLYDVQMAKLYLAADEREKTKEIIYGLMKDASVISDTSPIKEPLQEVIDAYNQSEADRVSPLLPGAVRGLVAAESQDIISMDDATINGRLSNYMTSTLKYSKIGVFISKIDTAQYPEITAYVNINGEKDGVFGLVSDFEKNDFELVDTQYQIKDFTIDSDKNSRGANISIVLDCSGSMNGTPLADAKIAAKACIDKIKTDKQNISIVAYSSDAKVITEKTNNADLLINGINALNADGGTNIPSGIEAGVSSLSGSWGSKAIILLTDGQDGNSQAMDAAIESAIRNDVVIFTVGLGDVNDDYLSGIADKTGGKYIRAANTTELEDIYVTLQKYIVNNYRMKYTVKANPDVEPRNLMINLPVYQVSGDKDYFLSDAVDEEGNRVSGIQKTDPNAIVISAVIPNGLSAGDVAMGREITVKGLGFADGMKVSIGHITLTDIKLADGSSFAGSLKGSLTPGIHQLRISLPDGRVAIKKDALYVFRAGTTTRLRIGSTTVTADTIGQTGDKSFVAVGNVMINGFIHCDTPLTITANDLPKSFDIGAKGTAYLGNSGVLSGNGKLYISYAQVSGGNTFKKSFAKLALNGKDYTVQKGEFRIGIDGTETGFDTTLHSMDIQIPLMSTIEVARMKLYADRIQVTIDELNPLDILESISDGIKGSVFSTQKEKTAADKAKKVEKRDKAFKFKPREAIGGSLDVALTADDIKFGLTLSLESDNSIQFGSIGLDSAELKLNSLDPSNEYWKLSGGIDFSKIIKGFGGTGVSGLKGHIASYYWCFDEIEVSAELYPGIPIYNAIYIDSMGLNLDGASTLLLNSSIIPEATKKVLFATEDLKTVKPEDIILSGLVGADANLFKSFKLKVPKDFTKWGTLGEIDGKISYNFSDTQFSVKADMTLLKQKIANASIGFGKKGLDIAAGLQAELALLDCKVGGALDVGLNTTWKILDLSLGVNGHLDCGFLNIHHKGEAKVKFIAEFDGSYYAVELSRNHLVTKFWYDSDGKPFIWDRFHAETYFE